MRDLRAAIRNQPPAEHSYDWDPLHMPGAVQSYGVLLVADPQTRKVMFVSENAAELLGIAAAELLDKSYLTLTELERERRLMKEQISPETILFPNPVRLTIRGRAFDAVFHAQGRQHIIEIEAAPEAAMSYADMADRAVEELFDPGSPEELYQRAVRVVRQVTGFDRVMLYRFDERYNGQVLAESARPDIGSFLGLFFPSADISARVRELYLQNFTRYIPDIAAPSHRLAGIFPGGGTASSAHPVDMSAANLRSVAACHIDYLINMGVKASMSFSINVDNRLWGLFACHHYAPRPVSYEQRVICEQTAMMFIFKLSSINSTAARLAQRARGVAQIGMTVEVGATLARRLAALDMAWPDAASQDAARPMAARALAAIHAETCWLLDGPADAAGTASTVLTPQQKLLLDIVEADSAAVVRHGRVHRIGDAPPEMAIFAVASMFGRELPNLRDGNLPVFATDNLSRIAPVTAEIKDRAAGVMAISLADDVQAMLLWFRREQVVHATWAGNPGDDAPAGAAGNPRASFAAWKADIRDLSRPWVIEDVETAFELLAAIRAAEGRPLAALAADTAALHAPPAQAARLAPVQPMRASPLMGPGGASMGVSLATSGAAGMASNGAALAPAASRRRVIRVGQI